MVNTATINKQPSLRSYQMRIIALQKEVDLWKEKYESLVLSSMEIIKPRSLNEEDTARPIAVEECSDASEWAIQASPHPVTSTAQQVTLTEVRSSDSDTPRLVESVVADVASLETPTMSVSEPPVFAAPDHHQHKRLSVDPLEPSHDNIVPSPCSALLSPQYLSSTNFDPLRANGLGASDVRTEHVVHTYIQDLLWRNLSASILFADLEEV
jgi:hypothetical protein